MIALVPSSLALLGQGSRVQMPDVVFIAGYARSGSSLLASLLAQRPSTLNVGELFYLWDRGLAEGWLCSCGACVRECDLWAPVVAATKVSRDAEALTEARDRYLRLRTIGRLARCGEAPPADLMALAEATERVIRAAAEQAGATTVIDASKRASAALLLHRYTSLDVRVVHLVRDPRATVYSWSKAKPNPADGGLMPRQPPSVTSSQWLAFNLAVDRHLVPHVPTTRVRYKDLVADPDSVVRRMWADLDDESASVDGSVLPQHSVSGNPSRFTDAPIVLDDRWMTELPRSTGRLVTALTYPGLRRYGYPLRLAS